MRFPAVLVFKVAIQSEHFFCRKKSIGWMEGWPDSSIISRARFLCSFGQKLCVWFETEKRKPQRSEIVSFFLVWTACSQ